jgi:hypothetical protein
MTDNGPSPNVIVAHTEAEHRFYRLCAEWDRFPHARKTIQLQILDHPEWGIEVRPNDVLALSAQSTITVQAQTVPETPPKSNLSRLKQLA